MLTTFCFSCCRDTVAGTHTASRPCTSSAPCWTPEHPWEARRQSATRWSSSPSRETSPWISHSRIPWVMSTDPHLRNKVAREAPGSEWCGFLGRKLKVLLLSGPSSVSGYGDLFPFSFSHCWLLAPGVAGSMGCWLNLKLRSGQRAHSAVVLMCSESSKASEPLFWASRAEAAGLPVVVASLASALGLRPGSGSEGLPGAEMLTHGWAGDRVLALSLDGLCHQATFLSIWL